MVKTYIKLVRAKQWVKNAFVSTPLPYSFRFTELDSALPTLYAFQTKGDLEWSPRYSDTDMMMEAFREYQKAKGVSSKFTS